MTFHKSSLVSISAGILLCELLSSVMPVQAQSLPDGYYRQRNTPAVYLLSGQTACSVTFDQMNAAGWDKVRDIDSNPTIGKQYIGTCTSLSNILAPETNGPVKGANNKKSMGGGYAEAEATFYRSGLIIIATHSVSSSYTQGTKGSVFVVGSDSKGRALFASPVFDIPTACSKTDTCSSNRRDTIQYQVNSELAKYAAKIDVYVQDRSGGRSAREAINTTIKETCGTYDDLPTAAKAGIAYETGFSGCGSR